MKIRKSRPEDLERMLQLYADARVFMAEHGKDVYKRQTGSCSSPEIPSIRRRSMWRWHRTVRFRSC